MRMMQCHPNLDATVLEREHIRHVVSGAQLHVAIGPDIDDQLEAVDRQTAE